MSTYSLSDASGLAAGEATSARPLHALRAFLRTSITGIAASVAWLLFGLSCPLWNDVGDWSRTPLLGFGALVVAAAIVLATLSADYIGRLGPALRQRAPWLLVLGAFFSVWELATAKFAPPPWTRTRQFGGGRRRDVDQAR